TKPKEVAKMGIAASVIDGTVTYQNQGSSAWDALTPATQLAEGAQVKTAADSRAVLTLDDGSALRLDSDSTVELTSLTVETVRVKQLSGTVYSRVVPSDRSYVIQIDDNQYEAMGTAFTTIKNQFEQGVQVFHSRVKTGDAKAIVSEGKQYFYANTDAQLQGKVTDINFDALADNDFIKWNLSEDEKSAVYKNALGILLKVREKYEQKIKDKLQEDQRAQQALKQAQEQAAKLKAEKETAEKQKQEKQHETKPKVTRGTMTLSNTGETFNWSYTGQAVHGYKLVYSKSNTVPTFGVDEAIYFGSINETSGSLPDKSKTGGDGTYYVRVCAYTAGSENAPCVDYSSAITITR
ncbi:MAG: FecR domain-containing protein, partial [Candidatus Saccharimonadales bacterium]